MSDASKCHPGRKTSGKTRKGVGNARKLETARHNQHFIYVISLWLVATCGPACTGCAVILVASRIYLSGCEIARPNGIDCGRNILKNNFGISVGGKWRQGLW